MSTFVEDIVDAVLADNSVHYKTFATAKNLAARTIMFGFPDSEGRN